MENLSGLVTKSQILGFWGALLDMAKTLHQSHSPTFAQVQVQTFPQVVSVPQESPTSHPKTHLGTLQLHRISRRGQKCVWTGTGPEGVPNRLLEIPSVALEAV